MRALPDAADGGLPDGCVSGLIVVWSQPAPPSVPIEADLVDMLARIRSDEHAASYWY
jgi:hypothetical protein